MIITASIQKGGTGKTTTAAILAQAAASKGKAVLAVDLDPQGNLTFALGGKSGAPGSRGLLDGMRAERLITGTAQGIDLVPASWDLATVSTSAGSARRLQKALEPVKRIYDYIFIDAPAVAGELQYNALQASGGLIIPLEVDIFNAQSLYQILDTVSQIRRSNPHLETLGILCTKYDSRAKLSRNMLASIRASAEEMRIPYLGEIRSAIAVREAAYLQRSIYEYAPKSKPAQDYMKIFEKIDGLASSAK